MLKTLFFRGKDGQTVKKAGAPQRGTDRFEKGTFLSILMGQTLVGTPPARQDLFYGCNRAESRHSHYLLHKNRHVHIVRDLSLIHISHFSAARPGA